MSVKMIKKNVKTILKELPKSATLVAASKTRNVEEINQAISAGASVFGENYVQEAKSKIEVIGHKVKWHFVGHLQRNKVKLAVKLFDLIETLDSWALAQVLEKECQKQSKIIEVLIEVNSAEEPQKNGVMPQDVVDLVSKLEKCKFVKLKGLMTMGPLVDSPEKIRPFFKRTKELYDKLKQSYLKKDEIVYLSMGMSDTYKIAVEEGANLVRIGTKIFGQRKCQINK